MGELEHGDPSFAPIVAVWGNKSCREIGEEKNISESWQDTEM